jgi:alkylation response protein AidB-like acyl-CoA dehydrogenase
MDLSLTESQKMFKNSAREFFKEECPWTKIKEIDESESGFSIELWKKLGEMGWLGMTFPESCGGMGCGLLDLAVVYEEMGYALAPLTAFNSAVLCGGLIQEAGNQAQKERFLATIASGATIFSLAFTEPDFGWMAEDINLTASRAGAGYRLQGTKRFLTDAMHADWFICPVRTSREGEPSQGISLFLIEKTNPALRIRPIRGFTGEKVYELILDNLELPAENLLGAENRAWPAIAKTLARSSSILCAYMVGGCQYLLDLTVQYAQTRVQFNQPIGAFQWVQGYIIEQANQLERARWSAYEALWKLDSGKPWAEQEECVARAKAICSEAYLECGHLSHEVHAGIGVDRKYPLYLWSKKSKSLYSYLGDPNQHRKTIARYLGL